MELLFTSIPITSINVTTVSIVVPFGIGTAHQCERRHQHEQRCALTPCHARTSQVKFFFQGSPSLEGDYNSTVVTCTVLHVIFGARRSETLLVEGADERARDDPYYMRTATLVVVLGYSVCARGEPVELTAKNFDKKVFGTKSALVKFQAPW